jgi:hypothetical protein
MYHRRPAPGVVPAYLHNSNINSPKTEDLFTVGLHVQLYVNRLLGLLAEWTPKRT